MMSTYELTSYFVHNSIVYSDGKVICDPPKLSNEKIMICSGCNREFWRDDALLEDDNYSIQRNKLPQTIGFCDLYSTFDSDYSCKLATYFSNLLEDGFADTNKKKFI